jgi:hypothetical protein
MDINRFWQIIADTRTDADASDPDGNMDRQVEHLRDILSKLPPDEVRDFDRHFAERMNEAYRWDLWAAAYIIEGGCSDDGFMDFRSWLISMGQDVYNKALQEPESLVDSAANPTVEVCSFEEFQYVAGEVYGNELDHGVKHPQEPAGEPWEEDDEILQKMFPQLWAKFGEE